MLIKIWLGYSDSDLMIASSTLLSQYECSFHRVKYFDVWFWKIIKIGWCIWNLGSHIKLFSFRPDSSTHHRLGIRSLHDDTSDDGKIHFINQHDHLKSLQSADSNHVSHSRDQFQTQVEGSEKQCQDPKKNIFFLKTHKAGSTTVQNVLLR